MPVCGVPCSLPLEHDKAELFGSSRLLSQTTYVLVRACLAFNSLFWVVNSVRVFNNGHWIIFLTHLAFALQTLYFFLALGSAIQLWLTSGGGGGRAGGLGGTVESILARVRKAARRGRVDEKDDDDGNYDDYEKNADRSTPSKTKRLAASEGDNALDRRRKLQWALLIISADTSAIVSIVYWSLLYNGWLAALNFQLHVFNTVFMMLDVLIGSAPFEWRHLGVTYAYAMLYVAFTIVFYLIGGLLGDSYHVIYEFLDWGKTPAKALSVVFMILFIMLPLVHGLHVMIAHYREKLRRHHPNWGWQGTDQEELERVMEVSGMRDADVWAPLTAGGDDLDLYDSEEEEFGGKSAFDAGGNEEQFVSGTAGNRSTLHGSHSYESAA